MASDNVVQIEGDNWKTEVIDSELPVLADFWAEWCGPCKMLAPILDELADELSGKIKIAKINVDNNQQIATEFGIRSIPTMLVFVGGTVKEQMVGAMNKTALQEKLQQYV